MTRPGLVRADTIDLQNQDAPTTQDHQTNLIQHSDVGKHQASEIRHVVEERHSEEEHLHDAWSRANGDMENELTDDQLQAHNHENGDSTDDSEIDDDMLDDRISSSPSIDDGAYPAVLAWPQRSSSLTPPRQTLNCSAISTPNSSPFVNLPAHLPLSVLSSAAPAASPVSSLLSSSPFLHSPLHMPLPASPLSRHHHHMGEYHGEYHNAHDDHDPDDRNSDILDQEPTEDMDLAISDDYSLPHAKSVENLTAFEQDATDQFDRDDQTRVCNNSPLGHISGSRATSPASWSTVSDASVTSTPEDHGTQFDDDDDDLDVSFYSDDRFVDSGWGGECLRETEDIDFDFVYALHTFVATVEGQANAAKGDTMVLLDDSNSYWWLVRIVKDNSIGYLPAEHIETPTERLARLNKHRNVDLSAAMLGDTTDSSKNPLKKAMKRRKAKTVQFTAPTFVEASDYDYSSDEEDGMMPEPLYAGDSQAQADTTESKSATDRDGHASATDITTTVVEVSRAETPEVASPAADIRAPVEEPLSSPTLVDKTEAAPLKSSRKGTPRNADSFLKDDGAEPRKITLTPNLLRDDSNGNRSLDSVSASMESLEKSASPPDKSKDDKKKKEKKPGMLSGLFKSKKRDKRSKNSVDEDSDMEKLSGELARHPSESPKGSPVERSTQFSAPEPKSRGKLQKSQSGTNAPVAATAPAPAPAPAAASTPVQAPATATVPPQARQKEDQAPKSFVAELEGSTVDAPTHRDVELRQQEARAANETLLGSHTLSSITNKMRHSDSQDQVKPKKVKKAKARVELDDFDEVSDEEAYREAQAMEADEPPSNAFMHGTEMVHIPINLGDDSSSPDENDTNEEKGGEESSERTSSPSMLDTPKASLDGPPENSKHAHNGYSEDMADDDPTPVASKRQSAMASGASTPQAPQGNAPVRRAPSPPQRASSATPSNGSSARLSPSPASTRSPASTAGTTNTWSDASLRAWLDGAENDVRDMLVIIHDKSSVVPVSRQHPLMADLFTDESRRLAGLQDELDGLLGNWLARKRSAREVVTS